MQFLNRNKELKRLQNLIQQRTPGLVVVYGRRRVGKSRLLVEFCRANEGLYTVADQSSSSIQRTYFAQALSERLPGFNETEYADWERLLRRLSRDARNLGWKGPLILDEFPYWVASSPELPSVLQRWVDAEARENGLLTIIAGSSQEMMQGLVLHAHAPLYGRALQILDLQPLSPCWLPEALNLHHSLDTVRAYAIWGGIPRYWELAAPFGPNFEEAIDQLVLDPLGPLHREPERLLLEELPPAVALRPVLDAIGSGVHRLTEIAARLGQPATSLSRPLNRLCELGLLQRDIPFGCSEKTNKRTLYRIRDPFFRLWFRVVAPHRALLATAASQTRRALLHRYAPALFAQSWEVLCLESVARGAALRSLNLPDTVNYTTRRWWQGNAPEWDLVAAPLDHGPILLGEAKWSDQVFSSRELHALADSLLKRPLPPNINGPVQHLLMVPNAAATCTNNGVLILNADDLLQTPDG